MCLSVLLFVTFIAISASLSHLKVVDSVSQRQQAKNLAESAIARAMEEAILAEYKFGSNATDRVEVTVPGLADAEGIVTFNRGEFSAGYSTNNIDSDTSIPGSGGTTVPSAAIHFVARGRVGNVERWVECVFHKPPYPDGLVSSGKVEATGLQLMGVRRGEDYKGGNPTDIPVEDQTMANLFANGNGVSSGPAVVLKADCEIHGSVGSPGAIEVNPASIIRGELLPGHERRPIPSINLRDRISKLNPNSVPVAPSGAGLTLDKSWFNHSPGSLTVGGDLDLNGSALTVNGDLTVNGAVRGIGIIMVDGKVEIRDGGSDVTATDQVAVAATGDVTLQASSPEGNYFQGLIYSEGDIEARDITVVGTVVTNGQRGSDGSVLLENVRFVHTPTSVDLNLTSMRGFGFGGRSTAVSITLTPSGDGETFLADVRVAFSKDGDIDDGAAPYLDKPIEWDRFGDKPKYKTWSGVNVGKPGPGMGSALAAQIGNWASSGSSKWVRRYEEILSSEMNGLFDKQPGKYEQSFSLNNLFAEQYGDARVLLWRPFGQSDD